MAEIRAVLFDFDGLLANTEPLHFETFLKVLAENDVRLPPGTEQSDFTGIHDRASFRKAFRKAGRSIEPDLVEELVDRKSALYLEEAGKIELFEGVRELLDSIPAGLPYTIASGGRRMDILAVLRRHGLAERFPAFVCGDDVDKSKPDPECFLKGLELLREDEAGDLDPESCLTFEDSFRGIEAAKNAGMQCVAVTHSYAAAELSKADRVLDSLLEWNWD
tara:strand:- start:616 stop:1275 length:660 start_codon:yes stop_codon:yes gene_type:complete